MFEEFDYIEMKVVPKFKPLEKVFKIYENGLCECNYKNFSKGIANEIFSKTYTLSKNDFKDVLNVCENIIYGEKTDAKKLILVEGHNIQVTIKLKTGEELCNEKHQNDIQGYPIIRNIFNLH